MSGLLGFCVGFRGFRFDIRGWRFEVGESGSGVLREEGGGSRKLGCFDVKAGAGEVGRKGRTGLSLMEQVSEWRMLEGVKVDGGEV